MGLGIGVGFGEVVELWGVESTFPVVILWEVHSVGNERNYYIIILLKLILKKEGKLLIMKKEGEEKAT